MIETLQHASTVRLLVAAQEDQDTLFVRLSPDVLSTLVAAASCQLVDYDDAGLSNQNGKATPNRSREWRLVPPANNVSFLPLEILVGDCTIYASYNGGLLPEESRGKWLL
jgi:hypothetical protein